MANQFAGRRVAAIVVVIVALTAVIPPAGAYALARWRVTRAWQLAEEGAASLGARKLELQSAAGMQSVVCGPGRVPRGEGPSFRWVENPVAAGSTFAGIWPQDPWGRCYLLNVRALTDTGSGLLISAGPNGEIDTPLGATAPAGDDIAATVR